MAGDQGPEFEFAPRRIVGPRPAGRRRLRAIVAVGIVLAIPAIALVGPRSDARPAADRVAFHSPGPAIPRPTNGTNPTPRPTASPLPAVTIAAGDLPPGPLVIDASGLRTLDPATGALGRTSGVRLEDDAVFRAVGGDGWWCICFDRLPASSSETAMITIRHLDRGLREVARFDVATASSVTPADGQDFGVRFDVERSADGRNAYLAWVERALDRWHVRVAVLDLAAGAVLARSDVADLDSPIASARPTASLPAGPATPPAETFSGGPNLRLAPDNATLLLTTSLDSFDPGSGESKQLWSGWLLDVSSPARTGPSLAARPVKDEVGLAIADCRLVGWLAADRLLVGCWEVAGDPNVTTTRLSVLDLEGNARPAGSFDSDSRDSPNLDLDLANGLAYAWEPLGHVLHRVDLATGMVDTIRVDPTTGDVVTAPPARIVAAGPPEWKAEASAYAPFWSSTLLSDPGGNRLYALGLRPGPDSGDRMWPAGSTGIWAFDVATLRLLDHWPAAAPYVSLALSADGRWLTAVGQGGVDTDGNPAAWPWSASIHDTTDGRLAVRLGDLGDWQVHVP